MLAIRLNPSSLISRATGPNTRVPFGFFSATLSRMTAALSPNLIDDPSRRLVSFFVLTITASTFSCAATLPLGAAFFTTQRIQSPTRAINWFPFPGIPISWTCLAPVLSATSKIERSCNILFFCRCCYIGNNQEMRIFTDRAHLTDNHRVAHCCGNNVDMCFVSFCPAHRFPVQRMPYFPQDRYNGCLSHFC